MFKLYNMSEAGLDPLGQQIWKGKKNPQKQFQLLQLDHRI